MRLAEALIALLFAVAAIAAVARRVHVPYPILLVLGGLGLGFLPFVPRVPLDPELILLFFLPPLLYADSFQTSWIEFRRWLRPILMLSVGLVAVTVVTVAFVARAIFPELSWPAALALGAVVSPTDTIAAQAVIERLRMPRRITAILGGESLVNDATGLVAFQVAITVAIGGTFEATHVGLSFLIVAAGGVAVGVAVGWLTVWLNRRVRDTGALFALSLLAPYFAYVVCWNFEVSGVLAVVVAGFIVSWRIHELEAASRHQLYAVWTALVFLITGFSFVLLGLEVPRLRNIFADGAISKYWLGGAAVCATVMGARLLWVWPGTYLPRWLSPRIRKREPAPRPSAVLIVGWCGMRGVVSLAAALSVPRELSPGVPFAGREVIVFCTFCTILGTLVIQGLTLEPLIRALGIATDELTEQEVRRARIEIVNAALRRLQELRRDDVCEIDELQLSEAAFRERLAVLEGQEQLREHMLAADHEALQRSVQLQVLAAQKAALVEMRDKEEINDATQLQLQMELDLEEMRLVN